MLIPGPKLNTLFRSRWNALLWAAGVLLTAYCSVPEIDQAAGGASSSGNTRPSTSPWARDPAPTQPTH